MIYISVISGLIFTLSVGVGDFLQSTLTRKIGRFKTLFIRFLFTIALLIPFCFYLHIKGALGIGNTALLWLIFGTIFYLIGYINYLKAFEIGNVSVVSPISSAGAAVTIILSAIFLNEHLSVISYLSILLIMIGIGLTSTDLKKLRQLKSVKGLKESIITMFLFGIYFFTIGFAGKTTDPINLFVFAVGMQSVIFLIFNSLKMKKLTSSDFKGKMLILFIIITILYIFAWLGFNYGASKGIVSIVSPVSALYPIVTVLLATIFYKEKLVANQIAGIVLTIVGLLVLSINP